MLDVARAPDVVERLVATLDGRGRAIVAACHDRAAADPDESVRRGRNGSEPDRRGGL
jgi:hypothetical protein